jgi:UDP-2,3-diacylglucosamine pyrophosphatase LpxH
MIYCISDLHLADKGSRDNFFSRGEERLHRFLDLVGDNELIILGDLFDWWQVNLSASVVAYRKLLERLSAHNALLVFGNHDQSLNSFVGTNWMPPIPVIRSGGGPFTREIGGRRFAFLHGHEADPYCSDVNPGIGEITAIMSALLEDKNGGPGQVEDKFIGSLEAPLNLWRRMTLQVDRRGEMLSAVEKYRIERDADVVVSGHTHEEGRIGEHHYNCGCWCRDRDGFTRIDDAGVVTMWTWAENHTEPFEKILSQN